MDKTSRWRLGQRTPWHGVGNPQWLCTTPASAIAAFDQMDPNGPDPPILRITTVQHVNITKQDMIFLVYINANDTYTSRILQYWYDISWYINRCHYILNLISYVLSYDFFHFPSAKSPTKHLPLPLSAFHARLTAPKASCWASACRPHPWVGANFLIRAWH